MRVALAISSYNGDEAALQLARAATSGEFEGVFTKVAVVDSGEPGCCAVLRDALAAGHPDVEYLWHEGNLGSAGNLVTRLRWAQHSGAQVVLALNADGVLIADNVIRMLGWLDHEEVAAVYPTHVMEGDRVDLSGRRRVPVLPSRVPLSQLQDRSTIDVRWGSSNGALYRMDALGSVALDDIASLWYGWEDLGIGLSLDVAGHRQVMCLEASQPTASDQKHLSRTNLLVSAKAPWTTYYSVRNLVLLAKQHPKRTPRIALRISREFVMILVRDRRVQRYTRAVRGLTDGLRGRTGQRIDPTT